MTLVAGLRAASYGIPFQPVAGVFGSDLARINGWKTVADPYTGTEVYVIAAIPTRPTNSAMRAFTARLSGIIR